MAMMVVDEEALVGLQALKCTNCGSSAVKAVEPDAYFCRHCDGVFKWVRPHPRNAGGNAATCYCGASGAGVCVLCGQAPCPQHQYLSPFVICWSCSRRCKEVEEALRRAHQSAYRSALAAIDAEYQSRPPIPYEVALAWLSGGSPEPEGYRWGSFTARQLASLLAGMKRAPGQVRLRRNSVTGWIIEEDRPRWDSGWHRRVLTTDGQLWREYRPGGRRATAVEHYGTPDSVVPEHLVRQAVSRDLARQELPDLGRYTFPGWLAAGQPDLGSYLRESAWSAG
jgi:hypothetical protein